MHDDGKVRKARQHFNITKQERRKNKQEEVSNNTVYEKRQGELFSLDKKHMRGKGEKILLKYFLFLIFKYIQYYIVSRFSDGDTVATG
jgi:hypothetical protein